MRLLEKMTLDDALREGFERTFGGLAIRFRFLRSGDAVDAITELLRRAYAPLAAAGMRFVASHQDSDVTRERLASGDSVLALSGERIVATVTLVHSGAETGAAFYGRDGVAHFGQFAVDPELQRSGIGSTLLEIIEELARIRGVKSLGLDTSEHAADLIRYYEKRGYVFVEHMRWPDVNYRSVILAKDLCGAS